MFIFIRQIVNPVSFRIYDNSGRIIYEQTDLSDGSFEINATAIKRGLYYYSVSDNDKIISKGKTVIVH